MDLGGLWYWFLGAMLAVYVVLDGFDLGAGAVLPLVAHNHRERSLVIRSLGPVWDGNEVWLIAAGGILFLAFPRVYAASFSGFYLPLTLVLWLLTFRALGIELYHHLASTVWRPLFEFSFSAASALLIVILGAALGNVVRGVETDAQGHFFLTLFTDFSARPPLGILDWYTLLAAATALVALARHGAFWLNWKCTGPVQARAQEVARRLELLLIALALLLTAATVRVQPLAAQALELNPWTWAFPALACVGLGVSNVALKRGHELTAWLGSALFLVGLLGSAAAGLYPTLLPASGPGQSLTVANSASPPYALGAGLAWWLPGMALAGAYFVALYRGLPRKFSED